MDEINFRGAVEGTDRKWEPAYLQIAASEGRKTLNAVQYDHSVRQVLNLCEEDDPTHSVYADVRAVDEVFELRDKYGVLGNINLRIFFTIIKKARLLVVLGVWKKENEDQTPVRIVKRMKWRKRRAEELVHERIRA